MTKLEVVFVLRTNNRVLFVTLSSLFFFHITTYIGCLLEEIYLIPFNNWVESWTFGDFQMLVVICGVCCFCWGFPGGSDGKESACNAGLIPRWEDHLEEGMPAHSMFLPEEFRGQRSLAASDFVIMMIFH